MRPLLFVNWRSVHRAFCGLMWLIAVVLAVVVIAHTALPAGSEHHVARVVH
jgi:hypothetical protein